MNATGLVRRCNPMTNLHEAEVFLAACRSLLMMFSTVFMHCTIHVLYICRIKVTLVNVFLHFEEREYWSLLCVDKERLPCPD